MKIIRRPLFQSNIYIFKVQISFAHVCYNKYICKCIYYNLKEKSFRKHKNKYKLAQIFDVPHLYR